MGIVLKGGVIITGVSDYIQSISQWVVKLAFINLLWFLFSFAGGILFGWAPATISLFAIMRRWINKEDIPLFSTFLKTYKSEFIKANISGSIIVATLLVLITNMNLLFRTTNSLVTIFLIGNGTLLFLATLFITFFFPIYVHYQGCLQALYKKAFLLGIAKLPISILIIFVCFSWVRLLFKFPGLIFFFSVSIPVLLITFIVHQFVFIKKVDAYKIPKVKGANYS